jgi:hypothetical protein
MDTLQTRATAEVQLMEIQFLTSIIPIVKDAEVSRSFYGQALGLTFEGQEGD